MCLFRKVAIPDVKGTDAHTGGLVWKPEGKKTLGSQGVDGTIILKYIFKK
jgi:hypothetical protein